MTFLLSGDAFNINDVILASAALVGREKSGTQRKQTTAPNRLNSSSTGRRLIRLAPRFLSALIGLRDQFSHPRTVPPVEHNSFRQPVDRRDGMGNVDGDAATAQWSIADVQVPKGLGKSVRHVVWSTNVESI